MAVLDAVESYNEQWVDLWQEQERLKLVEADSKVLVLVRPAACLPVCLHCSHHFNSMYLTLQVAPGFTLCCHATAMLCIPFLQLC